MGSARSWETRSIHKMHLYFHILAMNILEIKKIIPFNAIRLDEITQRERERVRK